MSYAEGTTVSPEKTKLEIELLVKKYGATNFASGWADETDGKPAAVIGFRASDRYVRFVLPLPRKDEKRFERDKARSSWGAGRMRSPMQREQAWEAEVRRLWRALLLVLKAKLESVASKVETFEDAFMSNIVMPDGRTVGEHVHPAIAESYKTGRVRGLLALPAPGETA